MTTITPEPTPASQNNRGTILQSPVRIGNRTIKTVRGAEQIIRDSAVNLRWYGMRCSLAEDWAYAMEVAVQKISDTTGETPEQVLTRLDPAIERSYAYQVRVSKKYGELRLMRFAVDPPRNKNDSACVPL